MIMTMIMAMCTNNKLKLSSGLRACVYVSITHTLSACSLFYYIDVAVVFSVCLCTYYYYYYYFSIFTYIYIYIYFKCFLIKPSTSTCHSAHDQIIFTEPMRCGSPLGSLEGNLFSLHFCMLFSLSFLSFSLSLSLSLFFSP